MDDAAEIAQNRDVIRPFFRIATVLAATTPALLRIQRGQAQESSLGFVNSSPSTRVGRLGLAFPWLIAPAGSPMAERNCRATGKASSGASCSITSSDSTSSA